jgi:hypothetical protein
MRLMVHVQPLYPVRPGDFDRTVHQLAPDTPATPPRMDRGVQQEGVHASIPGEIDITYQIAMLKGADKGQAVPVHRCEIGRGMSGPARAKEIIERVLLHCGADDILYRCGCSAVCQRFAQ